MAYETLIVAFRNGAAASAAVKNLRRLGIPSSDIKRHPVDAQGIEEVAMMPKTVSGEGIWGWLFGQATVDKQIALYQHALQAGGTIISVRVLEEEADRVKEILNSYDPVDLSETPPETH